MTARYEVTLCRFGLEESRVRAENWREACAEVVDLCERSLARLQAMQNPTARVAGGKRGLRDAIRFFSGSERGRLPRPVMGCMSTGDCAGFELRVRRLRK